MLIDSSKRYFERLARPRSLEAIPGASHSFTEEGVGEVLFPKTSKWFRRF